MPQLIFMQSSPDVQIYLYSLENNVLPFWMGTGDLVVDALVSFYITWSVLKHGKEGGTA